MELGFKLIRDTFIFTNKRLILISVQGLTGSKVEYKSIVYKSISRFSVETAGTFELDAELKIWVSSEVQPSIVKQFNKSVNIYEVQKSLASPGMFSGQTGFGIQFQSPVGADILIKRGIIAPF